MKSKHLNVFAVVTIVLLSFGFVACAEKVEGHMHTFEKLKWSYNDTHHYHAANCGHEVAAEDCSGYAKHNIQDGECSVCDYYEALTLTEFATDYKTTAIDFVTDYIRPSVVKTSQVKAEYYYIVGNDNNELTKVNIVWTFDVDRSERTIELAEVTLAAPIPFRYIVNNKFSLNFSSLDIDRTAVFEFNAKTNYNKQNIAIALYEKAGLDVRLTDLYSNAIYKEIDSGDKNYRSFHLLEQSDNEIAIHRINVRKGDGTDETLLNNIEGPYTSTDVVDVHKIDGTNFYASVYALENLGSEDETENPDSPETPSGNIESVQDLIDKYGEEVKAVLEDNYLEGAGKASYGSRSFNKEYLVSYEWRIVGQDEITKVIFISTYAVNNSNTSYTYAITTVNFDNPIIISELHKDTIVASIANASVTYLDNYSFNYNPTIQGTRADLTNAICNKVFGKNEKATRIFKDEGQNLSSTFGEVGRFTVIQITENSVEEVGISIKGCSADEQYIVELSNGNYTFTKNKYDISGTKVTA
ncbi:MAG: hypothetical protein J1F33_06890 [Clostridiales bacterium]|nr:hypothetical protein [Clostridiales bacterium]